MKSAKKRLQKPTVCSSPGAEVGVQGGALEPQVQIWRMHKTKLRAKWLQEWSKIGRRGAKRAQDRPPKGSKAYDPLVLPVIAACSGGHFVHTLRYLGLSGASGAGLGVSRGALGLDLGAW